MYLHMYIHVRSLFVSLIATQHLKSVKHLEYAHNNANFTSLDDIIAKGKSLAEFVSSVRATYLNPTPSTPR